VLEKCATLVVCRVSCGVCGCVGVCECGTLVCVCMEVCGLIELIKFECGLGCRVVWCVSVGVD